VCTAWTLKRVGEHFTCLRAMENAFLKGGMIVEVSASLTVEQVREALKDVPDPELPVISVIDMGIVRDIRIDAAQSVIQVDITPTFAGCPAIPQIKQSIQARLSVLAEMIEVHVTMQQPWSSDQLSEEAREKLAKVRIAPPPKVGRGRSIPVLMRQSFTCPHCGSQQTSIENVFGPTPCRALAYCANCHQPFEQFKPIG
jgi:ring-1,2-phenylacetyl-CoA epoxidase subunit PaaD